MRAAGLKTVQTGLDAVAVSARAVGALNPTVKVGLTGETETLGGLAAVTSAANVVMSLSPTVNVGVSGTTAALSGLATVTAASNVVGGLSPTVRVGVSGVPAAVAGLTAVAAASTVVGASSAAATGPVAGLGVAILGLLIAAAVAPAVGLLSAAIAGLSAVAAVAVAALGAIALGMDGIKKAAEQLTPAFTQMKADVSTAFVQGLQPAMRNLAAIMPVLSAGMVGTAGALSVIATQVTAVLSSAQGMQLLAQTFAVINGFLTAIAPAVAAFTQNFLTLAAAGGAFLGPLAAHLTAAAQGFGAMIAHAQSTGVLTAALAGLADTVGVLLGFLNNLVGAGLQAWAVLAGPMNTAFTLFGQLIVALMPALTALTQLFLAVLNPVLAALIPIITALTPAFTLLAQMLGTLLGGALQAVTPLLVAVAQTLGGALAQALTAIAPVIPVVVGAVALFAQALLPLVPVLAQVAGTLISALAPVMPVIAQAFAELVVAAVPLVQEIVKLAAVALPPLVALLPPLVSLLLAGLVPAFRFVVGVVTTVIGVVTGIVGALTTAVSGVINFVSTVVGFFTNFESNVTGAWISTWDTVTGALTSVWATIKAGISAGIDGVVSFFTGLPGRIAFGLGSAVAAIIKFAVELPGRLRELFVNAAVWLVQVGVDMMTGLRDGAVNAAVAVTTWIVTLPARIRSALADAAVWLVQTGSTMLTGLRDGAVNGAVALVTWLVNLPTTIKNALVGAAIWLVQTGHDLIAGLWNGILGAFTGLMTWVAGLVSQFIDGFKAGLGIASPSTIFAQIGQFLIDGLIAGLQTALAGLRTVVSSIASGLTNLFMTGISFLSGLWTNFWAGLQLQVATAWATLSAYVQAGWAFITALFNTAVTFVVTIWTNFWNGLYFQVMTAWALIQAYLSAAWAVVTTLFNAAVAFLVSVWTNFWNGLIGTAQTVWTAITAFFTTAFATFTAFFTMIWGNIQLFFVTTWITIQTTAATIWNAIVAFLTAGFNAFIGFFNMVWGNIQLFFATTWLTIQTTAATIWNAIVAFLTAGFNSFVGFFTMIWGNIQLYFQTTWLTIQTTAATIWNAIVAFFTGAFDSFRSFFQSTWEGIVATFDRVWSSVQQIAQRVWDGVRGAFVNGVNAVIDIINRFADAINFVAGLLGFDINLRVNRLNGGGPVVAGRHDGGSIAYKQVIHRATGGGIDISGGGMLPGYTPGKDIYPAAAGSRPYALGGGEYVTNARATRSIGPAGMHAVNNAHRTPVDIVPRSRGGATRLAAGGPVWSGQTALGRPVVDDAVSRHGAFLHALADRQAEAVQAVGKFGSVDNFVGRLNTGRADAVKAAGKSHATMEGYPRRLLRKTIHRDLGGAIAFARSMSGKPYIWGGATTAGTDCCVVGPVRVYGSFGAKPISEIQPGDEVYSYVDGKLVTNPVTAAWKSRTQPVFKVRTRNRAITASANHPFLRLVEVEATSHVAGRRGRLPARYDTEWVRLDKLSRGDLLIQPRDLSAEALPDPVLQDGTPIEADVAWLIGLIVGDGTVIGRSVRVCVYGEDRERADWIARERWGGHPGWSQKQGMVIHSKALHDSLAALGMELRGSNQRVPAAVWSWPTELQRAFVDGYCDADGHRPANTAKHGQRTYHSASRELIEDVRALHITIGDAVSNVSETKRTKPIVINGKTVTNALPLHSFTVWNGKRTGETVARKDHPGVGRWMDESGDFTVARVLDITDEGVQDTYDLTVEGSHNFIADGVVVHNSGYQGMITRVLRNQSPARIGSTADFPWPGFVNGLGSAYSVGSFKGSPGHMAGTLAGVNVESGGSPSRVKYGAGAVGADHGQFGIKAHLPEAGGVFASGGGAGGGISFGAMARSWLDPLYKLLTPIRDNAAEKLGNRSGAGGGIVLLDKLVAAADALGGGGGAGTAGIDPGGPVVEQVRAVANRYSWGSGPEWDALAYIIHHESGWDPAAANSTTSARGLAQKMTNLHGPVEPTAAGQADWMMNYIRGRYGTPTAAKRYWDANKSYDLGGGLGRGFTGVMNTLPHMETVLPLPPDTVGNLLRVGAQQTAVPLQPLSDTQQQAIDAARGRTAEAQDWADQRLGEVRDEMAAVRELLERRGAGAQITVEDRSGDPSETARTAMLAIRTS